ncbi:pilus assembly protein TadG-related protein [Brevibacterium renqingii]|uniref:pilus assembly protein TadG-related protein n=1 Tax=Brevibacterium renqingii TaxID=2776916 RepID=UPI002483E669|nr:pilus assembly protein TadG-related protein [Brevibacterium renqingii]
MSGAHRLRKQEQDRGSATPWFLMIVMAAFLFVGVSVDTGGKLQAANRAEAVAGEAARAGANALDYSPSKIGDIHLGFARAQNAAEKNISVAGYQGEVTVTGREVTVTTTGTYKPVFLTAIGIKSLPVDGHATARLVAPGED